MPQRILRLGLGDDDAAAVFPAACAGLGVSTEQERTTITDTVNPELFDCAMAGWAAAAPATAMHMVSTTRPRTRAVHLA